LQRSCEVNKAIRRVASSLDCGFSDVIDIARELPIPMDDIARKGVSAATQIFLK